MPTASNIRYMEGNLKIYEITNFLECYEMHIKSSMFAGSFKDCKNISMPYLSAFRHDQISNGTSDENTNWVLCCSNIYNFITKGDGTPQHIIEVSRMSDTYKTSTTRFLKSSEQVLDTKFVASMGSVVGRISRFLNDRILTKEDVLGAFDHVLGSCKDDKRRENVDKKFDKYTDRNAFRFDKINIRLNPEYIVRGSENHETYGNCLALCYYDMEKQLSKEEFDGWKETVVSVILDPNNNCRQDAFRRILSSVNVYANLQITIIEPRQRVGVKVIEIKMLPKTGENNWVNENIVDQSISKKALIDPW